VESGLEKAGADPDSDAYQNGGSAYEIGATAASIFVGGPEVAAARAGARGLLERVLLKLRGPTPATKSELSAYELALRKFPRAAQNSPKPPGFDPETWQWMGASRLSSPGKHWYDPSGGEWRYHPADKWHDPHWDYNPWTQWNSPWQHY
jgi:hypothetical protein